MNNHPGYGVCGHKNAFSTGVKVGNYVEDRFGRQLAEVSRVQPLSRQSEAAASYVDPKEMPDKCANAPKENLHERAALRAGLSYNLVFEHGRPHLPTTAELTAKYNPTSNDIGGGLMIKPATTHQENSLTRQRELKLARETREQRHQYVTTAQSIIPTMAAVPRR